MGLRNMGRLLCNYAVTTALVVSLVSGCVSGPRQPPERLVVERSELGRPKWVEDSQSLEPLSEKWFLYSKRELLRLDLGIHQTQAAGLALHCKLISDRMRLEIQSAIDLQKRPEESGKSKAAESMSSSETIRAVNGVLEKLASTQDCPELEPKDLYWEAVRRLTPEGPRVTYDVYVLFRLKQVDFDEVLAMTANSLKLSGRADLETVAEVLKGRMSTSSQKGNTE